MKQAVAARQLMGAGELTRRLRRIAHEIREQHSQLDEILLVGIKSRGGPLATRLADTLRELTGTAPPVYDLDPTPYRDDQVADLRSAGTAEIPSRDRTVVLVDDVLYTGRTVRAALDALSATGRPARVQLAVVVDRGHRELPIRPDYVGKNLPTSADERVAVRLHEVDGDDGVWIEAAAGVSPRGKSR